MWEWRSHTSFSSTTPLDARIVGEHLTMTSFQNCLSVIIPVSQFYSGFIIFVSEMLIDKYVLTKLSKYNDSKFFIIVERFFESVPN